VVIPACSTCTMSPNYPGTELVGTAFRLREKKKKSLLYVHLLRKTLYEVFHVVVLQRTAKRCTKMYNTRDEAFFCLFKLLLSDFLDVVVVAVTSFLIKLNKFIVVALLVL